METITTYKGLDFKPVYECPYASAYYNAALRMMLCVAKEEYIPIEEFKTIFLKMSDMLDEFPAKHLVFDKRKLGTFHQPSMEWYFSVWKPQVKLKGLDSHYKLLPDADWFAKAVAAGKNDIYERYGTAFLDGISINYMDTLEEVIEELLSSVE
ncbi:MAG: hypothetical protein JWO09_3507 [Bacteroidetes bacterium]|nr:hypothetical protein [Bacteroidota bacterium]